MSYVCAAMDILERIIREATAKSKDGRIDEADFLNHCASSTRYSLFTPMEASIIFHFAGGGRKRLALIDFASLLDPRWKASPTGISPIPTTSTQSQESTFLAGAAHSAYSFVLGGMAGSLGATIVYPIDLGRCDFHHFFHRLMNVFVPVLDTDLLNSQGGHLFLLSSTHDGISHFGVDTDAKPAK
jgi:hypothetical protein